MHFDYEGRISTTECQRHSFYKSEVLVIATTLLVVNMKYICEQNQDVQTLKWSSANKQLLKTLLFVLKYPLASLLNILYR